MKHFAGDDDERPSESDTSREIVWPVVDDVFFCCEWLPAFRRAGEARA